MLIHYLHFTRYLFVIVAVIVTCLLPLGKNAAADDDPARPPSLKTIPIPEPSNLERFVKNKHMAIILGKALFWDMQVGSDGMTACASCHFNAGADSRSKNQVNPGQNRIHSDGSPQPDQHFDYGPNRQLILADFPFRELSDPLDRSSPHYAIAMM